MTSVVVSPVSVNARLDAPSSRWAYATEHLDLSGLEEALEAWRQGAWVTSAHGHETYRQVLASARSRPGVGYGPGNGPREPCRGLS